MDPRAIFGIDILMSFVSSFVIARLYVWSWLRGMDRYDSLIKLVAPHIFLRFIGLSCYLLSFRELACSSILEHWVLHS